MIRRSAMPGCARTPSAVIDRISAGERVPRRTCMKAIQSCARFVIADIAPELYAGYAERIARHMHEVAK